MNYKTDNYEIIVDFYKGTKVEIEHTILYNRQDKVRHIHKILGFEISGERNAKTGEFTYGKYNPTTKRQEGIQIKNIKTGEVVAKFDLSYGDYIKLKPELDELKPVLQLINELNDIYESVPIDIEFAITCSKTLWLLQVRPLITSRLPEDEIQHKTKLKKIHKKSCHEYDKTSWI